MGIPNLLNFDALTVGEAGPAWAAKVKRSLDIVTYGGVVGTSPAAFGATFDGSDDTQAWQDCLGLAGGEKATAIIVPSGGEQSMVEETLELPGNVFICGAGGGLLSVGGDRLQGSVLGWAGASGEPMLRSSSPYQYIEGLGFDGHGDALTAIAWDSDNDPIVNNIGVKRSYAFDFQGDAFSFGPPRGLVTDAAMADGSTHLTSATADFTTADVGKLMWIEGAASGDGTLIALINAYVSPTEVILSTANASGGAVSATQAMWYSEKQMDAVTFEQVVANVCRSGLRSSSQNALDRSYINMNVQNYTTAAFDMEAHGFLTFMGCSGGIGADIPDHDNVPFFRFSEALPKSVTIQSSQHESYGPFIHVPSGFEIQRDIYRPITLVGCHVDLPIVIDTMRYLVGVGCQLGGDVELNDGATFTGIGCEFFPAKGFTGTNAGHGQNVHAYTKPQGWGTPTGAATRSTFLTSTVTTQQLAERVAALIIDLKAADLLGA